ncbi:amidohydrolase, partial [Mesorhizobium metallidurans]|uniref:amidohydrolase n=1 Tax=Mesorhizobium metallidurans TaxID=489722 RepID=UPI0005916FFC
MPILNRVADLHPQIVAWRRDLHAHPEIGFDVYRTARFVEGRLREFGCDEVVAGVGKTGVVGVLKGRDATADGKLQVIGLRADMDALPIREETNLPYASKHDGLMHACGHDGHTAMLLGAARCLAETRAFAGTVVFIFEPAEEIGTGAQAMLDDGLMERFGIEQVFGMHTLPGMPVGSFGIRTGPVMAATDSIEVQIEGRGGHPGMPHETVDAILVAAQLVTAMQQILSQNVNPLEAAGISFHELNAGTPQRVIAHSARLCGSMRTLDTDVRELVKRRIVDVTQGVAQTTGARINVAIESSDAIVFNDAVATSHAMNAASQIVRSDQVVPTPPKLGGEDFSYLARARPGAFIWCGNGDSAALHHPAYDFNDEAALYGSSYWVALVESTLAG